MLEEHHNNESNNNFILPVVLVGRFGQTHLVGFFADGFTVRHNRVGLLNWDTGVVIFQIFQTNFQVEFSGTGDDVFSGFFDDTLHHRVGFSETF